jgi:hypothetical protein
MQNFTFRPVSVGVSGNAKLQVLYGGKCSQEAFIRSTCSRPLNLFITIGRVSKSIT